MTDKTLVLERLKCRDAERIEKIQKAHKAKEDVDVSSENEQYFSETFKSKSNLIEEMLTCVPSIEVSTLPSHFESIKKEINDLQKFVVTSALFLKEFQMRKYLGIVQNLQTQCYELEDNFKPRKKFGFNKKKITKVESNKGVDLADSTDKKVPSKWEQNLFGFDSKENEVLTMQGEEIFQRDVTLRKLKNCTVSFKGVLGTLHMSDLDNCIILCGPVMTSVFLERCMNCKIIVACQQLRMHSSVKCDIYLHVTCKGIIEDCSEIYTCPYNLQYDELDSHFELSSLDRNINHWDNLDDFNWLAPDVPSPNWSILNIDRRITDWQKQWSELPT